MVFLICSNSMSSDSVSVRFAAKSSKHITKKQSCLTRLSHDYTDCIIHDMLHLTGFTVRTSEINLAGYEVELLETHPLIDGKTTKVPTDASLRNSAQMFSRSDSLQ